MSPKRVSAIPVEARPHQGMRAGIVSRVIANSADSIVIVVALTVSYLAWAAIRFLSNPTGFTLPAPAFIVDLLIAATFLFLYFTLSWATSGRTYGDHLMGLRVVNYKGGTLRWWGAMVRAVFCVLFPLGLFWVIVSIHNRSVQDAILRTSVIYDWGANPANDERVIQQSPTAAS